MIRVLLLLAALATPAAENPALQQALNAYDNLDYDTAGRLFDQVLATGGLSKSDQKIADFYAGIVYFDLSQPDKARDVFTRALGLDPTLTLDSDASPKLQDFFASVKKDVVATPPPAKTADVPPAQPETAAPKPALTQTNPSDSGDFDDTGVVSSGKPIYKKPVFWVGIGAAVVAVAVVVVLVATHHGSSCTSTGNNGCIDVQVQQKQGLVQW